MEAPPRVTTPVIGSPRSSRRRTRVRELGVEGGRLRLVGVPADEVVAATGGSPALAVHNGPVVSAGRVELLTFLREQAVSVTAHRFGTPHPYDVPATR